jgi:hypothetical protein
MSTSVTVYLEQRKKRTFAGALDWPGWCRHGPNESDALSSLLAYGPRYASVLAGTQLAFVAPTDLAHFDVVERMPGTATTDFGAPGVAPSVDRERSCDAATLRRFQIILTAGWHAFDKTVEANRGKTLATGPRGGGRSLEAIVGHVVEADRSYLGGVGWKAPTTAEPREKLTATRTPSSPPSRPPLPVRFRQRVREAESAGPHGTSFGGWPGM